MVLQNLLEDKVLKTNNSFLWSRSSNNPWKIYHKVLLLKIYRLSYWKQNSFASSGVSSQTDPILVGFRLFKNHMKNLYINTGRDWTHIFSWLISINNIKMPIFPSTTLTHTKQLGTKITIPVKKVIADNNYFIFTRDFSSNTRSTYENLLPSLQ